VDGLRRAMNRLISSDPQLNDDDQKVEVGCKWPKFIQSAIDEPDNKVKKEEYKDRWQTAGVSFAAIALVTGIAVWLLCIK